MILIKTNNLKELKAKKPSHIKVTLVKSTISRRLKHKRTVSALGLSKLNKYRVHPFNAQILGMVQQVSYLLQIEIAKDPEKKIKNN